MTTAWLLPYLLAGVKCDYSSCHQCARMFVRDCSSIFWLEQIVIIPLVIWLKPSVTILLHLLVGVHRDLSVLWMEGSMTIPVFSREQSVTIPMSSGWGRHY